MNIFVTGATGFIGSNFLEEALKKGFNVTALKNKIDSKTAIKLSDQPKWLVSSLKDLEVSYLKGIDIVVHFASAGVSPKEENLEDLFKTNVVDSFELIKKANNAGCKRIIVSGSAFEYGYSADLFDNIPFNAPLIPLNNYGISKAAGFYKLFSFSLNHSIELYYSRIFSVYGHGQHHNNFWPSLYHAATTNKNFKMTSGNQIRDFISIEKVIKQLINACLREDIYSFSPLVENIGSGNGISLRNFAEIEWKRLSAKGRILFGEIENRENEIQRLVALIDKNNRNSFNLERKIISNLGFKFL